MATLAKARAGVNRVRRLSTITIEPAISHHSTCANVNITCPSQAREQYPGIFSGTRARLVSPTSSASRDVFIRSFSSRCMRKEGFSELTGVATNADTGAAARGPEAHDEQKPPFKKLLVANRGEIACRIMRTARRMGIATVAVYSTADVGSLHVRLADEAICIGPAQSTESYLNMDAVINAVKTSGAQAVHPGYGFLSENPEFAKRLEAAGIVFVGPSSSSMAAMGDKIESKSLAKRAGISTVPGREDVIRNEDHAAQIAAEVGYPVMMKASAGGGGKGMRVAWNDEEARDNFRLCQAEALSSFADGRIFIERFIERPRHIEIQIMADQHGNAVYLPERECSIQRRNQKVIEEAPSTFVIPELREAMGKEALALAAAVGYSSAGTVEFLVDSDRNFYFLEMNTRLQVEHPVTECITGLDLVELMIRVAAGETLQLSQERAAKINGWAMEARIYAEDARRGFLPSNGRLRTYQEPPSLDKGRIVRLDSGVEEGNDISIYYDPLISKLTTWGPDRAAAIAAMEGALDRYVIRGLTHNAPFLRSVVAHPAFLAGALSTGFLKEHYPTGWAGSQLSPPLEQKLLAIAAALHLEACYRAAGTPIKGSDLPEPVDLVVTLDGQDHPLTVAARADSSLGGGLGIKLDIQAGPQSCQVAGLGRSHGSTGLAELLVDGEETICQVLKRLPRGFSLQYAGAEKELLVQSRLHATLARHMPPPRVVDYSKVLLSPMPGALISLAVVEGQEVAPGQELAVVEAMKMRNVLRSERAAKVKAVMAQPGSTLAVDQVILRFE